MCIELRGFGAVCARNAGNRLSRRALGPSDSAFSGSSCTSTKMPETPTATAAEASGSMNCGWPPDLPPARAGQLDAVGGVENHRPAGVRHDFQAAHIDHQVVVAERRTALGQHHLAVAGGSHLIRRVMDIVRRHELALFDIDDLAGAAGFEQQIGLAAKECRDLQDVDRLGGRRPPGRVRECRSGRRNRACADAARIRSPSVRPGPR